MKGKRVVLSVVFLCLGFLIAFSYNLTRQSGGQSTEGNDWDEEYELRDQYIQQEAINRDLQKQLLDVQNKVAEYENEAADEETVLFNLAEDIEKYRLYLGKVKVKGPGIDITLEDGEYDPVKYDANSYIVHEQHVFQVINELYISGAEAVAINGQRLKSDSYIVCNGPVITVDGNQHPAPFVISAIGDPEVLEAAVMLPGGTRDQLVNGNIVFSIESKEEIELEPVMGNTNRW